MIDMYLKHITVALLFFANNIFSANLSSTVVRTDNGLIDYANRVIVSRGTASILDKELSQSGLKVTSKNIKLSKGEAKLKARENLLSLVKIVNFDGRTVGELMLDDPLTESRVKSLVSSAYQQGEIEYLERKEVAIALAIKMSGLAEILVDAGGHLNEGLSQSTFLMTKNSVPRSERASGIVIDARSTGWLNCN